ncbi:MAG: HAD-IIA family hydrolase [bacterium]
MTGAPRTQIASAGVSSPDTAGGIRISPSVDQRILAAAMAKLKLIALDCDGVIWVGESPLPGANELVLWCRKNGIRACGVTNNSSRGRANLGEKAARLGIPMSADDFYTTNHLATEIAAKRYRGKDVLVLGSGDLLEAVQEGGANAVPVVQSLEELRSRELEEYKYDALIVGYDRDLRYAGICHAAVAIKNGADFISTNSDFAFPVGGIYLWPGNGAIADMLSRITGVKPETHGKPEPGLLLAAMRGCGAFPNETLMVGDRVETDIACGKNAGAWTCLVGTGVQMAGGNDPECGIEPDLFAPDLPSLLNWLIKVREEESRRKA